VAEPHLVDEGNATAVSAKERLKWVAMAVNAHAKQRAAAEFSGLLV
jgi:hypothetical protein